MEDVSLDDSQKTVLTCSQKNYLNTIISGDLNETSSYLSDSSEEETEVYINNLIKRLTLLDKEIWYSIEVIQNNVCDSLSQLSEILLVLPDRDTDFKKLVNPLKRVEELTLSIERKYDKTHKLRQLKNLKTLLTSNQKVLSLIYNWDDNIRSVQSLITSYLNNKDTYSTSNRDFPDLSKGDFSNVNYFILGSSGFSLDDLDKLKSILLQLKGDYDTCLNSMINTNIPQTLSLIMDKYYIILEDLTVDILHLILLSYNFYESLNLGRTKDNIYKYNEEHYDRNTLDELNDVDGVADGFSELNLDSQLELMRVLSSTESNVKRELERYVNYYVFEKDSSSNMSILNRQLKNKLEDLLLNYFRNLCTRVGFDLFSRSKGDLDVTNNLKTVEQILNSLLNYLFVLFLTFKDSFYYMYNVLVSNKEGDMDLSDYSNRSNIDMNSPKDLYSEMLFYKDKDKELENKLKAEELFRKLVLNTFSSCILNSNLFYMISTLRDEELYRCLNYVFNTFEEIFTKYKQYLKYLNVDRDLESMTFIPFDVLDKYVLMVYNQAKVYDIHQLQRNYIELLDSTSSFRYLTNQLNKLYYSLESEYNTRNTTGSSTSNSSYTSVNNTGDDNNDRNKEERGVLNWLYIYCILNNAKVEFDSMCEETEKYVSGYFGSVVPKVEMNPISTNFELNCRNFLLDLMESHKTLVTAVESLLNLSNKYLKSNTTNTTNATSTCSNAGTSNSDKDEKEGIGNSSSTDKTSTTTQSNNKIDRNIYNCLKEQHDWKLSTHLLGPFREVVFKNKNSNELLKEFEMDSLLHSVSKHISQHISSNISYLMNFYYNATNSMSGVSENDNVNMYIEIIGEYYINLLSIYYENSETFTMLQKSMEMFIDSEFEALANLKAKTSALGYKKNIEYLIKIAKLVNVPTLDSLSMLIN